jgi:hypothetical protein
MASVQGRREVKQMRRWDEMKVRNKHATKDGRLKNELNTDVCRSEDRSAKLGSRSIVHKIVTCI